MVFQLKKHKPPRNEIIDENHLNGKLHSCQNGSCYDMDKVYVCARELSKEIVSYSPNI